MLHMPMALTPHTQSHSMFAHARWCAWDDICDESEMLGRNLVFSTWWPWVPRATWALLLQSKTSEHKPIKPIILRQYFSDYNWWPTHTSIKVMPIHFIMFLTMPLTVLSWIVSFLKCCFSIVQKSGSTSFSLMSRFKESRSSWLFLRKSLLSSIARHHGNIVCAMVTNFWISPVSLHRCSQICRYIHTHTHTHTHTYIEKDG